MKVIYTDSAPDGGTEPSDSFQFDAAFEFDAPTWADIAAEVDGTGYDADVDDAWFRVNHPLHEPANGPVKQAPLLVGCVPSDDESIVATKPSVCDSIKLRNKQIAKYRASDTSLEVLAQRFLHMSRKEVQEVSIVSHPPPGASESGTRVPNDESYPNDLERHTGEQRSNTDTHATELDQDIDSRMEADHGHEQLTEVACESAQYISDMHSGYEAEDVDRLKEGFDGVRHAFGSSSNLPCVDDSEEDGRPVAMETRQSQADHVRHHEYSDTQYGDDSDDNVEVNKLNTSVSVEGRQTNIAANTNAMLASDDEANVAGLRFSDDDLRHCDTYPEGEHVVYPDPDVDRYHQFDGVSYTSDVSFAYDSDNDGPINGSEDRASAPVAYDSDHDGAYNGSEDNLSARECESGRDDSEEEDEDLMLLCAEHNTRIGKPADGDDLILAVAEHNRRVAVHDHEEESTQDHKPKSNERHCGSPQHAPKRSSGNDLICDKQDDYASNGEDDDSILGLSDANVIPGRPCRGLPHKEYAAPVHAASTTDGHTGTLLANPAGRAGTVLSCVQGSNRSNIPTSPPGAVRNTAVYRDEADRVCDVGVSAATGHETSRSMKMMSSAYTHMQITSTSAGLGTGPCDRNSRTQGTECSRECKEKDSSRAEGNAVHTTSVTEAEIITYVPRRKKKSMSAKRKKTFEATQSTSTVGCEQNIESAQLTNKTDSTADAGVNVPSGNQSHTKEDTRQSPSSTAPYIASTITATREITTQAQTIHATAPTSAESAAIAECSKYQQASRNTTINQHISAHTHVYRRSKGALEETHTGRVNNVLSQESGHWQQSISVPSTGLVCRKRPKKRRVVRSADSIQGLVAARQPPSIPSQHRLFAISPNRDKTLKRSSTVQANQTPGDMGCRAIRKAHTTTTLLCTDRTSTTTTPNGRAKRKLHSPGLSSPAESALRDSERVGSSSKAARASGRRHDNGSERKRSAALHSDHVSTDAERGVVRRRKAMNKNKHTPVIWNDTDGEAQPAPVAVARRHVIGTSSQCGTSRVTKEYSGGDRNRNVDGSRVQLNSENIEPKYTSAHGLAHQRHTVEPYADGGDQPLRSTHKATRRPLQVSDIDVNSLSHSSMKKAMAKAQRPNNKRRTVLGDRTDMMTNSNARVQDVTRKARLDFCSGETSQATLGRTETTPRASDFVTVARVKRR